MITVPVDLVLRSRRVVTPEGERPATVHVEDGAIAAVSAYGDVPAKAPLVDAGGAAVLPGLVDTHVHVNEPGRTEWEGFASATRAAAASGVTTIIDMPLNSIPPTTTVAALECKREAAAGQCFVDIGFWGGAVPGNADQIGPLHAAGAFGVKAFLADSGVPEFPVLEAADLDAAARAVAACEGLLLVHAEDPAYLRDCPPGAGYRGWVESRPPEAEEEAVRRVAALAARHGTRVHVVHLSAAEALVPLRAAAASGRVSAETCPHYLALAAEQVPDGAVEFKCAPPIRAAANADALWAALADGTLSAVVSDHSPAPPALKVGDFSAAWGGIASLQLGLPVVWTAAARRGGSTLVDLVGWMAAGPARLAGLARKGAIAPGCDADLVVFDPDAAFRVDPAALHHRHAVTPYAGHRLRGVVRGTWLRGREVTGDVARGRLLSRGGS